MIGQRVEYRGSVEDAWGCRFVVAEEVRTDEGLRYNLATFVGELVLRNVRPGSLTVVSEGPKHRVLAAELRAQVVQGEFARKYPPGTWLPYVHDGIENLPLRVADLIKANRPVEAEVALLNAEVFVGCIPRAVFQARMKALMVGGDDESWMPQSASRAPRPVA